MTQPPLPSTGLLRCQTSSRGWTAPPASRMAEKCARCAAAWTAVGRLRLAAGELPAGLRPMLASAQMSGEYELALSHFADVERVLRESTGEQGA